MEELVRQYGYWMVAAGTVVEGDATVITAAFLAHRGYLSLFWVCILAGLTTVIENIALYEVARRQGFQTSQHVEKVLGWVRTRGAPLLFVSRFLIGVRSAAAMACGIARMPRAVFFWTNLAGAVVWTVAMAAAGYSGGHLFTILVDDVKRHEWTVAAILAGTVTVAVLWKTRAAEIVDLFGVAAIIETWAESRLSKRAKKMSPKS
jgi:membrane protein DedA with SNARE-associated domain